MAVVFSSRSVTVMVQKTDSILPLRARQFDKASWHDYIHTFQKCVISALKSCK